MQQQTKDAYKKLAANFYASRLDDQPPSPKRIADALRGCATEYRPAYWRRLRSALAYDQDASGYAATAERIRTIQNPVTRPATAKEREIAARGVKPKRPAAKAITDADFQKLGVRLRDSDKRAALAALIVAKLTGARPAEMARIKVSGGTVTIKGAKQREAGDRGIDRQVQLSARDAAIVAQSVRELQSHSMKTLQMQIRRAAEKVWPRRKTLPSLYTLRHQVGSSLKASGMTRKQVAYVMGHQATASVEVYGDKRKAGFVSVSPAVSDAEIDNLVRETHKPIPTGLRRKRSTPGISITSGPGGPGL